MVKRLDLIQPLVQGNKYYKLKYNLLAAKDQGKSSILTFGGAFSNHILATAQAAKQYGFKSIGIIRGEIKEPLNPTLSMAKDSGMFLQSISRSEYREKTSEKFIADLKLKYGDFYLIPEGGTNALAVKGCAEILNQEDLKSDFITVPIGTGGTFCGLLASAEPHQCILGFSSLKGDFINDEIQNSLAAFKIDPKCQWRIVTAYHFGGYAKFKPELLTFIKETKQLTHIPWDPIYTGKMMFGLIDLIKKDLIPPKSRVLVLHTGGIQGIEGFNERHGTEI